MCALWMTGPAVLGVPNRRARLAPLRGPPGVGYRDPIRRPVHELCLGRSLGWFTACGGCFAWIRSACCLAVFLSVQKNRLVTCTVEQ
jgi:hypothetical protein